MNIDNFKNNKTSKEYLIANIHKILPLDKIQSAIKKSLSDDLLSKKYKRKGSEHYTQGHCYVASEALFYLTGGIYQWIPQQGSCSTLGSHWWLKNKFSGEIIDITKEQFTYKGLTPPYKNSKGRGFLKQSNRCLKLMKKVLNELNINEDVLIKKEYC